MKCSRRIALLNVVGAIAAVAGCATRPLTRMTAAVTSPLARLMRGNARFVRGKMAHADVDAARRTELVSGQHPFAVIVACSDSRSSPAIIFDQGLGQLFVVRVAGEVVDDTAAESVQYAVEHLHVHLVMVLGHDDCGAVKAALNPSAANAELAAIIKQMQPAIKEADAESPPNRLNRAINLNAKLQAQKLARLPALEKRVRSGELKIVAARYKLATGQVQLLPDNLL
jgi:carbonic anhydrase